MNKLRHLWLFLLLSVVGSVANAQSVFDNLQTAFNTGGSVNLTEDVDLGDNTLVVPVNKSVTLDLKGFELKSTAKVIEVASGATLTIKDTSSPSTGKVISTANSAVVFKKGTVTAGSYDEGSGAQGATINIQSGNFQAQEMCVLTSYSKGNTVNISGGTFTSNDNAPLAGNGTSGCNGHVWNVSGGTFYGNITTDGYVACGIYAPNDDTWNITGGTFHIVKGAGIVQRAGTVTVGENVEIYTTGAVTGKVGDSRVVVPCAALVFDAYASGYPGLSDASQMVVNGGTFRSESNVVAVLHGDSDNNATSNYPNIRVQVNGGDFKENDNAMGAVGMNPGEIILAVNNSDLDENDFTPVSSKLVVVGLPAEATFNGASQVPTGLTVTYDNMDQEYQGNYTGASNTYGITIYKNGTNGYEEVQAVNVGTYLAVVNCNGETATGAFKINPMSLENATVTGNNFVYNTLPQYPTFDGADPDHFVQITLGGATTPTTLVKGEDYDVAYDDGADYTNQGTKTVILKAVAGSNYTAPEAGYPKTYQIDKAKVTVANFQLDATALEYTGQAQQPNVIPNGEQIVTANDVTASAATFVNVGANYKVEIIGKGNAGDGNFVTGAWNDETPATFTPGAIQIPSFAITAAPFTIANVVLTTPDPAFVYDGAEHKLPVVGGKTTSIVVTVGEGTDAKTLVEGDDYDVTYKTGGDYINGGAKEVYVTGKGNYKSMVGQTTPLEAGSITLTYPINPVDFATAVDAQGKSTIFSLNGSFTYDEQSHPTSTEYTAVYNGAGTTNLLTSDDFTVVYDNNGNIAAGSHPVQFVATQDNPNFVGTYQTDITIGEYAITINAAQLYKTYGQNDNEAVTSAGVKANYGDPTLAAVDFTIDDNSGVTSLSEDEKKHILKYLEFARANGDTGENAGDHDYLLKTKADMTGCNFTITIQHNTSKLIIRKAPLTIDVDVDKINANVRDTWKYFGENDPLVDYNGGKSFAFTIPDATQLKNGDTKETAILSLTREEGENAGEYPFVAEAPNYEVTITPANFVIRPTGDASKVEVAFTPASYEYKGEPWEPAPVVIYHNPLTGNNDILTKDVDYEYTSASYFNNVNATPNVNGTKAKLTVKLIRNFANVNKEGTFDITKAPLTITGKSYALHTGDAEPTAADLVADLIWTGLKTGDHQADPTKPVISPNYPKLKAPTVKIVATTYQDVYDVVVNADAVADNYTITYKNGLLTYGLKQIDIIADDKNAVYGEDPKELTVTYKWTDTQTTLTAAEIAGLSNILKPAGEWIWDIERVIPEGTNDGKDAGRYDIDVSGPKVVTGYGFNYIDGIYTIAKKEVIIRANNDNTKVYGEADPVPFNLDIIGLQYGEQAEDVLVYTIPATFFSPERTELVYTVAREKAGTMEGEQVGRYAINVTIVPQASEAVKNYTVRADNSHILNNAGYGYLIITKRPMLVRVKNAEKYYGQVDPLNDGEWEVEFEEQSEGRGLKVWAVENGGHYEGTFPFGSWVTDYRYITDEINSADWVITRERTPETRNGENAGDYHLYIRHATEGYPARPTNYNPNYDIITEGGEGLLTVKKAVLDVVALDQGIEYGKEINKSFIINARGEKVWAYKWAVATEKVDDEVTIAKGIERYAETPVANLNVTEETYTNNDVIVKVAAGATPAETLNDKMEEVLTLDTEVTSVGIHKPADKPYIFKLSEFGDKNYVINEIQGYLSITPLEVIPLNEEAIAEIVPTIAAKFPGETLVKVLDDHQKATVTVVLNKDRKFREDQWYSLVLPFDIKVRNLAYALGYAAIDLMNENNTIARNLSLELYNDVIKANTPFVVKTDNTIPAGSRPAGDETTEHYMGDIAFVNVTIAPFDYFTKDPSVEDKGGNTFIGTYRGKDNVATTEYALWEGPDTPVPDASGKDQRGSFFHGYTSRVWPLLQTEAYWVPNADSSAPVRITIQEADGTTTAISDLSADDIEIAGEDAGFAEGWYTVNGVKLTSEPTVSGTYIYNGKKVYVK